MNLEEAKLKLSKYGQEQILRYYDELSDDEKAALLEQIDKTDMEVLSAIEHKSELVKKGEITPLGAMELDEIEADYDTFKNTGVEAIKAGKVGAILLAGGMGTRLGSDNPKGMYNVGVNRELYIFECLINNLMDVVKETGTYIHLFVVRRIMMLQFLSLKRRTSSDIRVNMYISSSRRWQQPLIMMVRYILKIREEWLHHLMVMVAGISL